MAAFVLPYLFVVPRHSFRPDVFSALLATLLTIGALREYRKSTWLVLILLAAGVELPLFRNAFPVPGMTGLSKLIFVDAGLFAFLVIRPLEGIGFVWNISFRDILVGLREFLFFTPLALAIGFVLHFLHWHPGTPGLSHLAAGWVFTLLLIAVPKRSSSAGCS